MQGQTLEAVGIYMPRHNFTHGKIYVALSRVTSPRGIKILIIPDQHQGYHRGIPYTRNFVDRQLWDLSMPTRRPGAPVPALVPDYFMANDASSDEDDENIAQPSSSPPQQVHTRTSGFHFDSLTIVFRPPLPLLPNPPAKQNRQAPPFHLVNSSPHSRSAFSMEALLPNLFS
jgi:hypothetical protein